MFDFFVTSMGELDVRQRNHRDLVPFVVRSYPTDFSTLEVSDVHRSSVVGAPSIGMPHDLATDARAAKGGFDDCADRQLFFRRVTEGAAGIFELLIQPNKAVESNGRDGL